MDRDTICFVIYFLETVTLRTSEQSTALGSHNICSFARVWFYAVLGKKKNDRAFHGEKHVRISLRRTRSLRDWHHRSSHFVCKHGRDQANILSNFTFWMLKSQVFASLFKQFTVARINQRHDVVVWSFRRSIINCFLNLLNFASVTFGTFSNVELNETQLSDRQNEAIGFCCNKYFVYGVSDESSLITR